MKNLLVANYRPKARISEPLLRTLIAAQIENSLALGWRGDDIVLVTNLDIAAPVRVVRSDLNDFCLTGSKMFALHHLFEIGLIREPGEVWWAHDLDAWQNHSFDPPAIADIGLAEYSTPKFNGGSVFLRPTARDIVAAVVIAILQSRDQKEEPAINRVLRSPLRAHRVTTLDSTYNVGCSAFAIRYARSTQPILVSHFNPAGGISWRTHVDGINRLGVSSVSPRLLELLIRHFHAGIRPALPHTQQ